MTTTTDTTNSTLDKGLSLYTALEPFLYPSLNPALVLGQDISHHCPSLMYGELSRETLQKALALIDEDLGGLPPRGEGSFIDLGSGIGVQVFVAACMWGWKRCLGVEIYEKRAKLAREALRRWEREVVGERDRGGGGGAGRGEGANGKSSSQEQSDGRGGSGNCRCSDRDVPLPPTLAVDFACGDVIDLGVEGFQVLLLVSAAFTDALMKTLAIALDGQPVGTFAICITKGLPSPKWEVVHKEEREEPWGRAWLIIQKKIVA